jgi:hypothetical protein
MVFGGDALMAQTINVTTKSAHDLIGAGDEESLDAQDLLVENSRMRRQLATATEKERKTQEENDDLKRQVAWLQQQQEQLMTSHRRWEAEFEHAGRLASKEADVEGDEGMRSLQAGQEGYFERKAMVLASRITAIAKRSNWLQVQLESARDQAADARRRQVDAERVVTEIMQANKPVRVRVRVCVCVCAHLHALKSTESCRQRTQWPPPSMCDRSQPLAHWQAISPRSCPREVIYLVMTKLGLKAFPRPFPRVCLYVYMSCVCVCVY